MKWKKWFEVYQKEKIIAIFIFIWGLLFSFFIPTWQVPDEYSHIVLAEASMHNADFAQTLADDAGIVRGRIENNVFEKVDIDELKAAMVKPPSYLRADALPKGISLNFITHFPTVIGLFIGTLIGLPTYWVFQLCEVLSLIVYTLICYQALKLMPFNKELMAFVMLLPMSLQGAGSVSYDAIVLPLAFFLTAYILYLKFTRERITWKDVWIVLGCWGLMTYIKMPLVFMILLVLILPLDKMHLPLGKFEINERIIRRFRIPVCLLAVVILAAGIYCFRDNLWIRIVLGTTAEWGRTLHLLKETIKTFDEFLVISSVGHFGWFTAPVPYVFAVGVYIVVFLTTVVNGDSVKKSFRIWDRIVIWGTFFILTYFTVLSMVNHTITVIMYGMETTTADYNVREALFVIPYIGGLQGRYFIPYISLAFLPFGQIKRVGSKLSYGINLLLITGMLSYALFVIVERFWYG